MAGSSSVLSHMATLYNHCYGGIRIINPVCASWHQLNNNPKMHHIGLPCTASITASISLVADSPFRGSVQIWQLLLFPSDRVRLRGQALGSTAGAVQHWQNYLHQTLAGQRLPWHSYWARAHYRSACFFSPCRNTTCLSILPGPFSLCLHSPSDQPEMTCGCRTPLCATGRLCVQTCGCGVKVAKIL